MKILALGLDRRMAKNQAPLNESQNRQVVYAGKLDKLTIICKTPNEPAEYTRHHLTENLEVVPSHSRWNWRFLWDAWNLGKEILKDETCDLITVQEPFYSGPVGYLLAKRFNVPLNIQLHSDFFDNPYWLAEDWKNKILSPLGKYLIRRAASLRVVSRTIKDRLIDLGLEENRIFVCPIGINLENFQSASGIEIRRKYLKDGNEFLVLSVGRLVPAKDYDTLLKAAQLVKEILEKVKFVIVGDGKERDRLERVIKEKKMEDYVVLTGAVGYQALPAYYTACDVFLLTSVFEGFGRVLVEAGAAAKPVVCTLTAGASEIIQDQKTGLLTGIGDYRKLAEQIIYLLNNPRVREKMGRRARERVNEFHFDNTVRLLIDGWRRTRPL